MNEPKHYKVKLTDKDRREIEQTLLDCSEVYRWLRKDAKVSKNAIRLGLKIKWCNIYQTFRNPGKYLTLNMLLTINDLLPERTLKEILMAIAPDYNKEWWEMSDWEQNELETKLKSTQN